MASTTVSAIGTPGTPAPCATPGKDGSPTLSANPNTYYPGTASAPGGATSIMVGVGTPGSPAGAATTISAGDLLLVMQMQGADINTSNDASYGDGVAGGGASGNLTTNFTAGLYEYVVATNTTPIDVAVGGTITLASALRNGYVSAAASPTAGPRRFQVVRIPQYASLTLSGTITATPWNGSIGGIIALDVAGQTNFGSSTITATGRGFRGGGGRTQATAAGTNTDYVNTTATNAHAQKGEGTAGTPRYVNVPGTPNDATTNATVDTNTDGYAGGSFGRGAPGNAGGGGNNNVNNSGGGGGANGGPGGRGGNNFSNNLAIGGEPGASFGVVSSSRLVMGGGGGAGSSNNASGTPGSGYASSGAAGGGLVLLRTGTLLGAGTISANGGNANNSLADDGSGGGGAGGSIVLTARNPAGLVNLTLTATGGAGGTNTGGTSGPHGPGGGGGGGIILTNGAVAAATATAGPNGTTQGATPAFGATAGVAGLTNTSISSDIAGSTAGANCAADVTVSLAGPTTLNAGQPTGNFTAAFTNEGPGTATSVTRLITLPAGALLTANQRVAITNAYPDATFPTTTSISFGNLSSLAADASSAVTFAFTAPAATGASTLTGTTGPDANGSSEGTNLAPNQSTLALNTVTTADVRVTIAASAPAGAPTGTFTATFRNVGAQTADGVVRSVQLPAGLTGPGTAGTNPDGSSNNGVTVTDGYYNASTGLVVYSPSPTTIAVGSPLTSTISYTLASSATPVTAAAFASTTTNEASLRANNTATAVMPAQFDLATTLTGPTSTIAGSATVLYVTTSNSGPNAAPVAAQTVTIPSETPLTNVYLTNGGTYTYNTSSRIGTVTFPDVANLPSGATATNSISFTVPVNDASPTNATAPSATVAVLTGETSAANNTAYLNGNTTSTDLAVLGATTATNSTIARANEQTTIAADATIVAAATIVTYTVTATNAGSAGTTSVTNVVAKVQLLPGLTTATLRVGEVGGTLLGDGISFANPGGGTTTYNTTTGVLTYPTLASQPSGDTRTFASIAVTVPANVGNNGQLLATASVSTASLDPVPSDNTSSVAVKVRTTADLTTTLTGPTTTTTAGQTTSYTATFTNQGLGAATSVVETIRLPLGLSNVVVQDPSGNVINNAYNATTGLVTLPLVASNASGASQVYGVSFPAPGQPFVVSSATSSGTPDNVVANNASSVSTSVSPTADVALYASGPATAVAGNAVTYAVTAANNGPNAAAAVTPTLQLPAGLGGTGPVATNPDGSSTNGVVVSEGGRYNATTGLVTFPTTTLVSGASRVGLVTFTMPGSPADGLVSGAAAYSFGGATPSIDVVGSNNTAALTTSIAPATSEVADLVTVITPPASPTVAGSSVSYRFDFRNNSTTPATRVAPVAYLPAGLTGVVINDASGAVVPTATYNSTTGQVTFPGIASQEAGSVASYTVSLTAPANEVVIAASAVAATTSDPDPSNNVTSTTLAITPAYDVVTKLTGPTSATPGSTNTYTVTTTNNGPSPAPTSANATQTVTVPANSVVTGLPSTATYASGTGVITFATVSDQATGANGAVINTFLVQMPATGTLPLQANVQLASESNMGNNQDTLTTRPFNPAPVAQNVWNTLRSARGNTSNLGAATGLPIAGLLATDDGSVNSYTIVAVPSSAQGVLYHNNAPVLPGQTVTASGLSFAPTAGYVGNATFTYTATDNGQAVSNVALYTIPVAADREALYTSYNNNRPSGTYTAGTVLAQVIDPNPAVYNNAGIIYDSTGALQPGAANGLLLTGTNATFMPGSTPPTGVSLDAATGRIFVSGPLAASTSPQTYNLSVMIVDANGGTTIAPVTFTIGASPLPVTLTAFTAQAVANRDALLSWSTASEQNNDYFEVERSFDGVSFGGVARLAGQGTTAGPTAYSLTDAGVAAQAAGPVYYRLRQVDLDGTATYSPLRTVSFTKGLASLSLSLYPNPAADQTSLDLSQLAAATLVQAQLLDATGRAVRTWTLAGGQRHYLDLSTLASGSYLLLVTGTQPAGTAVRQTLRLTKE